MSMVLHGEPSWSRGCHQESFAFLELVTPTF